jgi:glycerol-1-phosphatase
MTAGSAPGPRGLATSDGPLLDAHDLLLVDLDGVAYLGDQPIDGAAAALATARERGVGVVFVTNNASRPPAVVASQLVAMGVSAQPTEVMTSAIAAAAELARRFPVGAAILVVGGVGVREALLDAGLRPVDSATDQPAAVMQGFAPEVGWAMLAEASLALHTGVPWIATNADPTLPTPRGAVPGNGSLVAALTTATGRTPEVIGKPAPALFEAALAASGGKAPLVVGDRLDTDIAGAGAAGMPGLLVLSGVSGAADLLAAGPAMRPDYLGRDLRALLLAHPAATAVGGVATCGASRASVRGEEVVIEEIDGDATSDGLDALRVLCALAWSADRSGPGAQRSSEMYEAALRSLDLN